MPVARDKNSPGYEQGLETLVVLLGGCFVLLWHIPLGYYRLSHAGSIPANPAAEHSRRELRGKSEGSF